MTSSAYRFGRFHLDPAARELWRADEELALPRRAFDCLVYLVEHRERAVGRDELVRAVWKHTNLTDGTLDQVIFLLRRALGDTSRRQRCIKTVRGFGYHWVAPVNTEFPRQAGEDARGPMHRRLIRFWMPVAIVGAVGAAVLLIGSGLFWPGPATDAALPTPGTAESVGSAAALVLPVNVDAEEHDGWIRFGAMEWISERLRAAGLSMVPGESVIVLMQNLDGRQDDRPLPEALIAATGAGLLVRGTAERRGDTWRVTLRGAGPESPPVRARGEAGEVLDAARIAADRMALSLGLTPAPEPDTGTGVTTLSQRVQAAILAGQWEVARELIDDAAPELRADPELRFQQARVELYSHNADAAEASLQSLLDDPSLRDDRVFRARALVALGGVHHLRGEADTARRLLLEATELLEGDNRPDRMCDIWNNLAMLDIRRGEADAARAHLARAHVACETVGNVQARGNTELHLGGLELMREDYALAARHFRRAAEHYAAVHSVEGELRAHANAMIALLEQLDLPGAAEIEPRVAELLTQSVSPSLRVYAALARARFLAESGDTGAAGELSARLLADHEGPERDAYQAESRLQLAVLALRLGDFARAASLADGVIEAHAQGRPVFDSLVGRALLIRVRADLARGDSKAAGEAAAATADWAVQTPLPSAALYAALVRARLAVAEGRDADAAAAFGEALSRAEAVHVPRHLLRVARDYLDWLLDGEAPDPEQALVVARRLAVYADHHYAAALLQLRAAHAMGAPVAWRTALERARRLAGERSIPEALQTAPGADSADQAVD